MDYRISYVVMGKHEGAWRQKKIAELSKAKSNDLNSPEKVRKAAYDAPVMPMPLCAPLEHAAFARERARFLIAHGATEVAIHWTAQEFDDTTRKWAKCGAGSLVLDSDHVPSEADFKRRKEPA